MAKHPISRISHVERVEILVQVIKDSKLLSYQNFDLLHRMLGHFIDLYIIIISNFIFYVDIPFLHPIHWISNTESNWQPEDDKITEYKVRTRDTIWLTILKLGSGCDEVMYFNQGTPFLDSKINPTVFLAFVLFFGGKKLWEISEIEISCELLYFSLISVIDFSYNSMPYFASIRQ